MVSSQNGLVRGCWTSEQWQRLPACFHQSQLTQRDFAARHGIGLSTLSKGLRGESKATLPPVKFQEVALPNTPLRYAVEVVSPQSWIVRLQNSSGTPTLTYPCFLSRIRLNKSAAGRKDRF
jgi:hypothetical protein